MGRERDNAPSISRRKSELCCQRSDCCWSTHSLCSHRSTRPPQLTTDSRAPAPPQQGCYEHYCLLVCFTEPQSLCDALIRKGHCRETCEVYKHSARRHLSGPRVHVIIMSLVGRSRHDFETQAREECELGFCPTLACPTVTKSASSHVCTEVKYDRSDRLLFRHEFRKLQH